MTFFDLNYKNGFWREQLYEYKGSFFFYVKEFRNKGSEVLFVHVTDVTSHRQSLNLWINIQL
jgi:hypothetical protein